MSHRIERVRRRLQEEGGEAVLLTSLPDIRWACGFTGSNGILIVREDEAHFVTDGRYDAQAEREVVGAEVHVPGYGLYDHVAEEQLFGPARDVLVQADHLSVAQLDELREQFPDIEWRPVSALLDEQVAVKDETQIGQVRGAQRITDDVFEHMLGVIEAGLTEREVAAEVVYQHLKRGADQMAFEPIVAAGENSSLPHARPSDRTLRQGDVVVLDMGCFYEGYASDMTRTVAIGEPDDEVRQVYELVLTAQKRAIEEAHAGMTGKELDRVARDVIEEGGYGEYFSHGLGHALGLQIKEWPRLSYHVEHVLPEGATVTVEPGIYLPEQFGVRIEDIIVLRADGCENLTEAPKDELICL